MTPTSTCSTTRQSPPSRPDHGTSSTGPRYQAATTPANSPGFNPADLVTRPRGLGRRSPRSAVLVRLALVRAPHERRDAREVGFHLVKPERSRLFTRRASDGACVAWRVTPQTFLCPLRLRPSRTDRQRRAWISGTWPVQRALQHGWCHKTTISTFFARPQRVANPASVRTKPDKAIDAESTAIDHASASPQSGTQTEFPAPTGR